VKQTKDHPSHLGKYAKYPKYPKYLVPEKDTKTSYEHRTSQTLEVEDEAFSGKLDYLQRC
jgi:hypothetical protein